MLKCTPDKFQSISLRQGHINEVMKIKVLFKYVESGPKMKLLGVTFDEHLKFTSYLDELSKRVSRKIGVLMRLKILIPTSAKLRIYKSFILPRLTYCQTVLLFCRKSGIAGRLRGSKKERSDHSIVIKVVYTKNFL